MLTNAVPPFGLGKTFGAMVGRCMPNSGHGGLPGTWVMTIFVFYGSAQIPNIEYCEVYGGLQAPGGISFYCLVKFPVECRQNHVWGPIFGPSYDHIYKNVHLGQILTLGNALGPKIWPFYQIYWFWTSQVFEFISKIIDLEPNPGFLK